MEEAMEEMPEETSDSQHSSCHSISEISYIGRHKADKEIFLFTEKQSGKGKKRYFYCQASQIKGEQHSYEESQRWLSNKELVSHLFASSPSWIAVLIAVIAILYSEYGEVKNIPYLSFFYKIMITISVIMTMVSGFTTLLSFLYLRGFLKLFWIIIGCFSSIIVVASVGVPIGVLWLILQ